MNRITPVALFLVVIIAAVGSFAYFVSPSSGSSSQTSSSYNSTMEITLYANANGWNYNSTHPNPTLYAKTHVLLEFKIIEQDNFPHTFTINPGPNESQSNAFINVNIPAIPGTVVWVNWSFSSPGLYTYWCVVHPETMVGQLIINSSANSSSSPSVIQGSNPGNGSTVNSVEYWAHEEF